MNDQTARIAREDQLVAELRERRLINSARRAEDTLLFIVVVLVCVFLIGFAFFRGTPADAAKRAVYKGTVTITITPTTKTDPHGMRLHKQWVDALPGAVKAAGPAIGKVRVCKEKEPMTTCATDVYLASAKYPHDAPKTAPYGVYLGIDCWKGDCYIWGSQISMSDTAGAKMTAAQRQAVLAKALKAAIPR